MNSSRRDFVQGAAVLAGLAAAGGVWAQEARYPARPVKLIVPFAAGGATDFFARHVVDELRASLGQAFVIDNRPGAGAMLGAGIAAKSPADGYTLLFMTNSLCLQDAINPPGKSYTLATDFAPVAALYSLDLVLAVNSALPVRSVAELVAYAKANPKLLNCASAGIGTTLHLAFEMFKLMTGADVTHVPYKDAPTARLDLVGGSMHMMFDTANTALALAQQGKVRILASTALQRSSAMPAVPTVDESGVKGFSIESFAGVLAPRGTPEPVLQTLRAGLAPMLVRAELREAWGKQGATIIAGSPAQFATQMKDDTARWSRVLRESGVKLS